MEVHEEEGGLHVLTLNPPNQQAEGESFLAVEPSGRRRISRVVVEHNDNLETFYDFSDLANPIHKGDAAVNDVFFDNDSFWSGSITWY
jgi:hypothetical protein